MPGTGITVLRCITPGYRLSRWTKPLGRFRPVLKTCQSRGKCQISPDMALGTTGPNPDPEGLIFGVLSNFSQSGSTVYLSSAPGVSSASQPRSPCTSWGPHEGRRTCGLRRWFDSSIQSINRRYIGELNTSLINGHSDGPGLELICFAQEQRIPSAGNETSRKSGISKSVPYLLLREHGIAQYSDSSIGLGARV